MAAWPELDVEALLGRLTARGVDFVVVGGIAAVLLGSARLTRDLDICYATDDGNLEALGKALIELNARLRGVPDDVPFVPDAEALRQVQLMTLATSNGWLDVMTSPDGAPPYDELRRNADRHDLGHFSVLAASVEDMLAMKRAADRDRDRADVEELEAIRDLRRQRGR